MNIDLAKSYFLKSKKRLKALKILFEEQDFSDVIREAQEIVELSIKGMLMYKGIDVPKKHDVSDLLIEYIDLYDTEISKNFEKIREISKYLRKEREFSFYGDIDFIPTNEYNEEDARKALDDAFLVVSIAEKIII
ncbi:MAG: HEPN domain-containing protein [Caldisericia bacterium]